ncbi:MAG: hypothetical protein U0794_14680, partial [Isosphaeraceae bacterium]
EQLGLHAESYVRPLGNLLVVLVGVSAVGVSLALRTQPLTSPPTTVALDSRPSQPPPPVVVPVAEPPRPVEKPAPIPPPPPAPPALDRVAIAGAEADVDAASRDRARAEGRLAEVEERLRTATTQTALDARTAKTLAFRVRDPSTRVRTAAARGGILAAEVNRLKKELDTLGRVPRPQAKVLSNKNPVARPADGEEHHFEIRRDRICYINLDRLLEMVKADAMLRIRLSDGARVVDARVGPVGPFALQYTLARSLPSGLDELVERRGVRYDLRGWEVVPEFEGRGETFETIRQPISEFARVVNRLSPGRHTITLWVYPDGFDLFRKVRDDLHARGFLVAARPLPSGMAIRGSPSGSLSAGQ